MVPRLSRGCVAHVSRTLRLCRARCGCVEQSCDLPSSAKFDQFEKKMQLVKKNAKGD
jgi:hypothetical protein